MWSVHPTLAGRPLPCATLSLCALLSLLSPTLSRAQAGDPYGAALAESVVARDDSPWSMRRNPAAVAARRRASVGLAVAPSRYRLDGDREANLVGSYALLERVSLGIDGRYLAAGAYVEGRGALLVGYRPTDRLDIGIAVGMTATAIDGYGSTMTPTLDIGVLGRPAQNVTIGAAYANIARGGIDASTPRRRLSIGAAYRPDSTLLLSLDVEHRDGEVASGLGLSWSPLSALELRGGLGAGPTRAGLGVAYRIAPLRVAYGAEITLPLGLTHLVGVEASW